MDKMFDNNSRRIDLRFFCGVVEITLRPWRSASINSLAQEAIKNANKLRCVVHFTHDGIPMSVTWKDSVSDIEREWNEKKVQLKQQPESLIPYNVD